MNSNEVPAQDIQVMVPPGAMVESLLTQMDEGRVLKEVDEALRRAHTELQQYAKVALDLKGKATVTLKINLSFYEGNPELLEQTAKVAVTVPTLTRTAVVKSRGGKMLCQPIGASEHNPDQQTFFDAHGNAISAVLVDRKSGEEIQNVAGRIGPKSAVGG